MTVKPGDRIKGSIDPGSFRDPSGRVFRVDGRIFRTVMPCAAKDFEYVRSTGLIDRLSGLDMVVSETKVEPGVLGELADGAIYVLEHTCLPFISYPYEWSFSSLKAAALHHLDVHVRALDSNVTLSDASAYNIQFNGSKPVFIDHLSFRRYRDGEFWNAHGQFCEQFLNPLLLRSAQRLVSWKPRENFSVRTGPLNTHPQEIFLEYIYPYSAPIAFSKCSH